MLTELYQYAISHGLSARPGFKERKIKAYLMFTSSGRFLGLTPSPNPTTMSPDIGSAANGTRCCNILLEKASIILNLVSDPVKDKNIPTKHAFLLSSLEEGASYEPRFGVVSRALSDPELLDQIREQFAAEKYKPADPIGFQVDSFPLERSTEYLEWWDIFRQQYAASTHSDALSRCLITGALAPAMATVPKVSGLQLVGGHTSGDAFLCFDKDAFQSYGLKKSANAAVSEEAMTAVNAALTRLIGEAETIYGAKLVHWYSDPDAPDLLESLLGTPPRVNRSAERDALADARKLIRSLNSKEVPEALDARYYILPLSGSNGRMMVRGWYEGSYQSLHHAITLWFDDLRLVSPYGRSVTAPPQLKAIGVRLLKPGGDPAKIWERMNKELSGLMNRLLYAIIQEGPLPDEVASRTLTWLRSYILTTDTSRDSAKASDKNSGDDSEKKFTSETLAFQILKAWLRRKQRTRKGAVLMDEKCNPAYPGLAFHCGRMMAVYAAIQADALGADVGTGVLQRYYASASTAPRLVLGKLASLSQHHLSKLEHYGQVIRYEDMLSEISCKIGEQQLPANLNLEQQAEFALGFYQQRAKIYTPSVAKGSDMSEEMLEEIEAIEEIEELQELKED